MSDDWQQRSEVYRRVPDLVGDPERALALLERLCRRTRDGTDLFFIDLAVQGVGLRSPQHASRAAQLRNRLFEHFPAAPEELFQTVETPRDGEVPLWREVAAGVFWMGTEEGEGHEDEHPRHRVEVPSPFFIAAVPVTNRQFAAFAPERKLRSWRGVQDADLAHHPAVAVSWFEAVSFCRWLSTRGEGMGEARLPREDEWEFACRAGTETAYWSGSSLRDLARVGWYSENSGGRTHRVGEKEPNPYGLYDLHGNVWEWTSSCYRPYPYNDGDGREDPEPTEARRVLRGGSWDNDAYNARAAYRNFNPPGSRHVNVGFRVVRSSPISV